MAGLVVVALVAAGCGSNTNGTPSAAPSASPPAEARFSQDSLKIISQYTGVKSGKATGTPIRIGFINSESGLAASLESTVAADDAIRMVNEYLGGVKGHPIELRKCAPTDAAQTEQCARDFAADPTTVAVLQGTVDGESHGMHSILSPRLPVLGFVPLTGSDVTATNTYYLTGGQYGALGLVSYAREFVRAKKVALLAATGLEATELAITLLKTALEAAGIVVTIGRFPFNSADLSDAVAQSRAQEADLLLPTVFSPEQCVSLSNAVRQQGVDTPVLVFTGCLGAEVQKSLGDYPRWQYIAFTVNAQANAPDELTAYQVRAFGQWYKPLESRVTLNTATQIFQLVLTLVKTLAATPGEVPTAAAASAQMKAFNGPVFLGVPRLTYGAVPGMPAIGSLSSRVYVYLGNGSWADTTAGRWIDPPPVTRR